ncbi:MAG: gliding motility-associated C-terminal domain-containing protein [Bacteroidota bacterium]|nr:gliding motility-associated C-terminal domain-containing protein [Bacteroidota bacterium]
MEISNELIIFKNPLQWKTLKYCFLLLFSIFSQNLLYATHIVGGEVYYRHISGNRYRITMAMYIDCYNGNPDAIAQDFDADFGVFDASSGVLLNTFTLTRGSPTRIVDKNYECVKPPTQACNDRYIYSEIITLPSNNNGLIIAYQRCCRNMIIDNLINPEGTGATYWALIPPPSQVGFNSNPVFKNYPPNFLCTDAPLTFDHSATDIDGDSLVYEFFHPYKGATRNEPKPTIPSTPPFDRVTWKNPYSTNFIIDGNPQLSISRKTGEIQITPNKVGSYVVGVRVLEYRDGTLIGSTMRDFQFNVYKCQFDIIAKYFIPNSQFTADGLFFCDDTVKFNDQSSKALKYFWDFGDLTTLDDTSTETNPTYIYPGDGNYKVTLKVKNNICEDEYEQTIKIREDISIDLGPDKIFCELNQIGFIVEHQYDDATKTLWRDGTIGQKRWIQDTGTFLCTAYFGDCQASDSLTVYLDPVDFSPLRDSLFCDSVNVLLQVKSSDATNFQWNTSPKDTFPELQVNASGDYVVFMKNQNCSSLDTVSLYKLEALDIGDSVFYCNNFTHTIDAKDRLFGEYLWNTGETTSQITVTSMGVYSVIVKEKQCTQFDTFLVRNKKIKLDLGPDKHFCDTVFQKISITNPDLASILWSNGSQDSVITITQPGLYSVLLIDTLGCEKSDSVVYTLTSSPIIDLGRDTSICVNTPIYIGVSNFFVQYFWNNIEGEHILQVADSGTYHLRVVDEYGCQGMDFVQVKIDENALPNKLWIPNAFRPNSDGRNDHFPYSNNIQQPEFHLRVYNRWGQKLFDSKDEEDGPQMWDGTYNQMLSEEAVYVYIVSYQSCDGRNKIEKGTFHLFR